MNSFVDDQMIKDAEDYIFSIFVSDSSGHDYYHSIRVMNIALSIAEIEGGDRNVIALAALLHDVDDRKLFKTVNNENAIRFMISHKIFDEMQENICKIIDQISFMGSDSVVPDTLEGKIVQDADRLDAIGAIGIGRAFAYGGSKGRKMHDPSESYKENMSADEYFSNESTTINHFYEKLLLLKDMMNTETAKKIAEHRHEFMKTYLDEFYDEWNGRL